jgi:hypothetical protein
MTDAVKKLLMLIGSSTKSEGEQLLAWWDTTMAGEELRAGDPRLQLVRWFRSRKLRVDGDRVTGVVAICKAWKLTKTKSTGMLRAVNGEAMPKIEP